MSIELVMPSNHLILCHPLLLPPLIFPSIGVFPNESVLCIRWPKYWSFSFSISPSNEYSGLISSRMDWLDLLAVQGTLKSPLQHHSSKASILQHSAFFLVTSLVAKTVKHLPTMWETQLQSLGEEDLLEKEMATHSSILPGKSHGQRSLIGYSPRGCKELDITERLHSLTAFFIVQLSHPYMTTGKTIALTRWTFVGKVMSLLFNMLSRLVITFLPRSKSLISWLYSLSAVILEPQKIKSAIVYPSTCHEVMGLETMILVF